MTCGVPALVRQSKSKEEVESPEFASGTGLAVMLMSRLEMVSPSDEGDGGG